MLPLDTSKNAKWRKLDIISINNPLSGLIIFFQFDWHSARFECEFKVKLKPDSLCI